MKKPCANCPFRADKRFPMLRERREEIADAVLNDGYFPCHQTMDYEDDCDEPRETKKTHFCIGAFIVMDNEDTAYQNQMVRLECRLGILNPEEIDYESDVFESLDDWIEDGD